jgi:hypothetical protein
MYLGKISARQLDLLRRRKQNQIDAKAQVVLGRIESKVLLLQEGLRRALSHSSRLQSPTFYQVVLPLDLRQTQPEGWNFLL